MLPEAQIAAGHVELALGVSHLAQVSFEGALLVPQVFGKARLVLLFDLGQETVARIDALGQVQQFLRRLKFPEAKELPPAGTLLEVDGQKAGHVTSASESPEDGCVVALGMIRCAHARVGTQLSSATGKAEVL